MIIRHLARTAALTGLLLQAFAAHAAQPLLTITDLGEVTGLSNLEVRDINNRGDVLIARWDDAIYVWNASSGLVAIREPGQSPAPFAISDDGEVVGINAGSSGLRPFRWDQARGFRVPRLEPGLDGGILRAVNSAGQVAGASAAISNQKHYAVAGQEDGALHRVRGAGKGPSEAYAVNAAGQMGGWVKTPGVCCESAALFDRKGEPTLIGTLANTGERDHSIVHALNDLGQAVGESETANRPHAFFWSSATGMLDIHPQSDKRRKSMATDINQSGTVVGMIGFWEHPAAFSWDQTDGFVDLNDRLDPSDPLSAVTQVTTAPRINDQGQIVANATVRGVYTVVLLTPAPASKAR